jgi:uncharacterized protein involved in oxidation of intracellular sulfur
MNILIIFNHAPYDGTDVSWNGLRLAGKLADGGNIVRIFLMNDAVDMARNSCVPPPGYDQDISEMLKALIARGVAAKACGTCMARCGLYKQEPYFDGVETSTMQALADWVVDSERVISL